MSEESNVWEAGDAPAGAKASLGAGTEPVETLPPVVDIFMATIEDFKVHWKGHLLAGLGLLVVMVPMMFLVVSLAITPMMLGVVLEQEILMLLGIFVYFFGLLIGIALVSGPFTYAGFAMENAHLDDPELANLGFTSGLSRLFERPVGAIGYTLIAQTAGFIGVFFFIIGAWIAQIFLHVAFPGMVVHKLGVVEAITRSFTHVKDNFKWHLGFWALGMAVLMVAGNIPIVGYAIGIPFMANYTLRGYRIAFGAPKDD